MTEVKVTYYPLRCHFGYHVCPFADGGYEKWTKCGSYNCSDESAVCKNGEYGNQICVYNRKVSSFDFDGFDCYLNYEFTVGEKTFNSSNSDIVTLQVDGEMIIDNRQEEQCKN